MINIPKASCLKITAIVTDANASRGFFKYRSGVASIRNPQYLYISRSAIIIIEAIMINKMLYPSIIHLFHLPLISLCKKTPNIALCSFLKQSFTLSKLLGFKNFASLILDVFLSKTENSSVFLQPLNTNTYYNQV